MDHKLAPDLGEYPDLLYRLNQLSALVEIWGQGLQLWGCFTSSVLLSVLSSTWFEQAVKVKARAVIINKTCKNFFIIILQRIHF